MVKMGMGNKPSSFRIRVFSRVKRNDSLICYYGKALRPTELKSPQENLVKLLGIGLKALVGLRGPHFEAT
jgi:hypothetical protein